MTTSCWKEETHGDMHELRENKSRRTLMLSSWVPPSTVYVYPTASWFTEQHEYVVPAYIDTELPSPQALAVFISPRSMKTSMV